MDIYNNSIPAKKKKSFIIIFWGWPQINFPNDLLNRLIAKMTNFTVSITKIVKNIFVKTEIT